MKAAHRIRLPGRFEAKHLTVLTALLLGGCASVSPPPPPPAPPPVAVPAPTPDAAPAPTPTAPEAVIVPPPVETPPAPSLTFLQFIELNDVRLIDVYVGMSRATVDKHMSAHETERFTNPYKRQTLLAKDGTRYDVQFYITRKPRKGKPITEAQTTPLIFRDDKLIAIGRYQLKKLRRILAN